MKVYSITISSINSASSRLRSFYPLRFAEQARVEVLRERPDTLADVLHIQKKASLATLGLALWYRLRGRRVIFDIDDQPEGFRIGESFVGRIVVWLGFYAMIGAASDVTTDTPERAAYWRRYGIRRISVIPDSIDIEPGAAFPSLAGHAFRRDTLLWVGYGTNLPSIKGLIEALEFAEDVSLCVVSDAPSLKQLRAHWPWVHGVPWKKDIMFGDEFRMASMVLNHDADPAAMLKSENKMVLAIAAGIVPIVSNTPAYARLARALDADRLVYNEASEVLGIARELKEEWIVDFLERGRHYIQLHYSAQMHFQALHKLIAQGPELQLAGT